MSKSYIYCELSEYDEFKSQFSCCFHGVHKKAEVKIDTGAAYSLVPLKTLGILKNTREARKKYYTEHDQISGVIHGVEGVFRDMSRQEIQALTVEERLALNCLAYWDNIRDIHIGDYAIGDRLLHVSCDTGGNILLGMDVLKDFDIHIGESIVNGKIIFIGCRKDKVNDVFTKAVSEHLGYTRRI